MNKKITVSAADEIKIRGYFRKIIGAHLSAEETDGYLKNKLKSTARLRLEAHVELCVACREKLEILSAYRREGLGELDPVIARSVARRLAHSPVDMPPAKPVRQPPTIIFRMPAFEFTASTSPDWKKPRTDPENQFSSTHRLDAECNLWISVRVKVEGYKAVRIGVKGKEYVEPLHQEGKEWIATRMIPADDCKSLLDDDTISVSLIAN